MKFRMFYGENCLTVPDAAVFSSETGETSRDCVFAIRGGRAVRIPVDVIYRAGDIAVISGEGASGGIAAGETVAADAVADAGSIVSAWVRGFSCSSWQGSYPSPVTAFRLPI